MSREAARAGVGIGAWSRRAALAAFACTRLLGSGPIEVDPSLPHYEPRPVSVPPGASYVQPDGSIFIAGASAMKTGLGNLNALFTKTHPGIRFSTEQPGSSAGPGAILFHLAAFAVMDRSLLPEELVPFDYLYHHAPMAVRTGRGSFSKRDYSPPIMICVNPANPIGHLTTEQVARIFTVGGGAGDITAWGQLGLTGPWARRQILVMGVGRRTGEGSYMRREKFGDFPLTDRYEEHKSVELGPRLLEDVAGIAMFDRSYLPSGVKVVPIGETAGGPFSNGSFEEVLAGRYPYTPYTYFFINRDPAKPLDPFVKEYVRMVLSKEGQQALTDEPNGFLPLSAADAAGELRKIE